MDCRLPGRPASGTSLRVWYRYRATANLTCGAQVRVPTGIIDASAGLRWGRFVDPYAAYHWPAHHLQSWVILIWSCQR